MSEPEPVCWINRQLTVLLDWDDTLALCDTSILLPGAYIAIEALFAAGHVLVLFSRSRDARRHSQRAGLGGFFSQYVHCTHYTKVEDIHHVASEPSDMLLFDDTPEIVKAFHNQGLHARLVRKCGLTFDHLVRARLLPPDVVYPRSPD